MKLVLGPSMDPLVNWVQVLTLFSNKLIPDPSMYFLMNWFQILACIFYDIMTFLKTGEPTLIHSMIPHTS